MDSPQTELPVTDEPLSDFDFLRSLVGIFSFEGTGDESEMVRSVVLRELTKKENGEGQNGTKTQDADTASNSCVAV
jgi:hypothetical protein